MLITHVALLFTVFFLASADFLENHTFQPPFQEVDAAGNRIVNNNWRQSGTTVVNNNFIRLTPDRQSKKGALWSRKAVGVPDFSTVLKFRISGQGKNFFGDGIGLWLVQQGYYAEGNLHGFEEKFVGVGIIFDTFRNTENLAAHRDVTVLINDGTKTYEMMTADVIGCNTNVRYHADRADFSVLDASRAKVVVSEKNLQVFIDSRNTGEWTPCVNVTDLKLPSAWVPRSHIGLTATTGQLADNHDIIYLKSFSDAAVLDQAEELEQSKVHFAVDTELPLDQQIRALEQVVNRIIDAHETLDHHVEHQFASVYDHIKNLIGKLEKREDKSETRLENLENLIKKTVEGSLETRLSALELQMKGQVDRKMINIESALDRKINKFESKATELAKSGGESGWKVPFFILVAVLAAVGVGLYIFYQKLRKMHLL